MAEYPDRCRSFGWVSQPYPGRIDRIIQLCRQIPQLTVESMQQSRRDGEAFPFNAFWTLDQYDRFIQHVKDIRARTALDLLFYSGVRCGELLALTLGDFDFQENMIGITRTRIRRGLLRPRTVSGVSRCPLSSCRRS
ncbi:MAG: tyrosine-type recombinase/integrase [Lachnospiraceae bacterium]|nr:tyrosine-type recombinase/integrase [Lachnospiraceae bacterium]